MTLEVDRRQCGGAGAVLALNELLNCKQAAGIDVGGGDSDLGIIGGGGMYLSGVTCEMVFVISKFDWFGMIEM